MLRRQVWRWRNRKLITALVGVVLAPDNLQRAIFRPPLTLCHQSNLAHSESVHHGYRQSTHTRLILHIEHRAIDIHSVGVGTIQHDDLAIEVGAGVNHSHHTYIIGIETQTHILHIHQQDIESSHTLIRRTLGVAIIERPDGDSCLLIHRVLDVLTRISTTSEAVLGREDADKVNLFSHQHIHKVLLAHHSGVVSQHSHTTTLQRGEVLLGALCTYLDWLLLLLRLTREAEHSHK